MPLKTPDWEALYRETIYAVSHDLGAPFRHVSSFSKLLLAKKSGLDSESMEWISHIHNAGRESQAMLEGLLKLSRVYSQQSRQRVVSAVELASSLECVINGELNDSHLCVNMDEVASALRELVENAKSYSDFLEPRLSIKGTTLLVTAQTQGDGISEEQWPVALQPLARLNAKRCAEHVGMGLPIAAALVGRMNGQLINTDSGVALQFPLV